MSTSSSNDNSNSSSNETEDLEDDIDTEIFEPYKPSFDFSKYAKDHPSPLVHTTSLSSVKQPTIYYELNLPLDLIKDGLLSKPQLETVYYACQVHESPFSSGGYRKGYFLGDGTGVGKGRQISAIILENVIKNKLVKHIWISASANLMEDAKRDLEDINFHKYFHLPCFNVTSFKPDGLKKRSDHSVVGEDFEGCIIFDESHKAKGINLENESKGTQTGKTVSELQFFLPKARVVYCSATGVSNIENIEYMNRLDLWGEKTLFSDFQDLKEASKRGGIGIMELCSAYLKSKGQYNARTLSGEGCTYLLKTTEISREHQFKYDESCKLWQEIWVTLVRGIKKGKFILPIKEKEEMKRDNNEPSIFDEDNDKRPLTIKEKDATSAIGIEKITMKKVKAYYWGAHQRFFRSLCQSLKVNDTIHIAKSALGNINVN